MKKEKLFFLDAFLKDVSAKEEMQGDDSFCCLLVCPDGKE